MSQLRKQLDDAWRHFAKTAVNTLLHIQRQFPVSRTSCLALARWETPEAKKLRNTKLIPGKNFFCEMKVNNYAALWLVLLLWDIAQEA